MCLPVAYWASVAKLVTASLPSGGKFPLTPSIWTVAPTSIIIICCLPATCRQPKFSFPLQGSGLALHSLSTNMTFFSTFALPFWSTTVYIAKFKVYETALRRRLISKSVTEPADFQIPIANDLRAASADKLIVAIRVSPDALLSPLIVDFSKLSCFLEAHRYPNSM